MSGGRARVGDLLVERGLVSREQLDRALAEQQRTGSRLGSLLVADGSLDRRALQRVLAEQWATDYVDLTETAIDPSLLANLDPQLLLLDGWMPVRREADGSVLVAVADEPTPEATEAIEGTLGAPVRVAVTTDWDIDEALQMHWRDQLVDRAALGLWRRSAEQSARRVMLPRQRVVLIAFVAVLVAATIVFPIQVLIGLSMVVGLGYLVSVGFKFAVCLRGARLESVEPVTDEQVRALGDRDLPLFTVLVPVFREASVIGELLENLGHLDYPPDRLEILLLLEEGDDETITAARDAQLPSAVRFLIIPKGKPQTKPKACNAGLFFARGEYLVIFDAEDRPDPDQLKKAVIALRAGGEKVVCVQAALNYWNIEDNILTRMFTLEYSFWFDYMLPGLDNLRLPIPLGGTSNHFRTQALRTLGGWDPFNVTEDADLGIRAAYLGYRVGVINSTTYEEANRATGNWIRQRSRWIKGYLQTLFVHLRHPIQMVKMAGLRQALSFVLLIGGTPASFLFSVPLYAIFVASLFLPTEAMSRLFPGWVLLVSWLNLLVGNAMMIYISMMGAFRRRNYRLVPWALLNPLYWLLHATAAYKAVWQLITKPHYWEKTAHGLSSPAPAAGQPGAARPAGANLGG